MAEDGDKNESRQSISSGDDSCDLPRKCGIWLSKKGRFCSSRALPTSLYCGNHNPPSGETRVPCPIDPSHTILKKDVASHVKKCSAAKQLKHVECQSYFFQGVNAGSDEDEEFSVPTAVENLHTVVNKCVPPDSYQSCGSKRAAIIGLSGDSFWEFVKRIEFANDKCCQEVEEIILQPSQCSKWWDSTKDRRLPFQEKHVSQQASLLGNLEAFGLLQSNNMEDNGDGGELHDSRKDWAYVEFGAGRGYLGHMLCDSYGVSSVTLVEKKAYKFKADRTLRQIQGVTVERLRTDIKDLTLQGVNSLKGRHYVAISKHLCGPATDFTLRCCLNRGHGHCNQSSDQTNIPILEGIGIATCCHHLCQWIPYVNKPFFQMLGFTENEFNMITWLTSWAVNETKDHDHPHLEVEDSITKEILRKAGLDSSESAEQSNNRLSEAMQSLDLTARVTLGRKCKHILDLGRKLWLKEKGMEAKIVEYISPAVTPENKLLLARKQCV